MSTHGGVGGRKKIFDTRLGFAYKSSRGSTAKMEENSHLSYEKAVQNLDAFYILLKRQILQYQSCTIGLFPSLGTWNGENQSRISHVRDSIYCAAASWALSQAYRKIDDDQGRTRELAQVAVKCMRGILFCWLRQADKVEKFKKNQSAESALHSVFDLVTGDPVYNTEEHEQLQIDAIALYLLFLTQMISSGLQIIFTMDEVQFIQNLVFYVERSYRTSDYGMWERGSKYNNGSTEIHASSIGFAKAALEAVNGINLYGAHGAAWSVVYVDIDAHNRNRTIFETILPRESNSKNTDSSLIPTISWPAFATHEEHLKSRTFDKILRRLKGNYGFKRFLRDGYKTELEDVNRKYYKPAEIKEFDGIESEWPMFYVYLIIDSIFSGDKEKTKEYYSLLEPLLIPCNEGLLLPKYYYVPKEYVEVEKSNPGSVERFASYEGSTDGVFMWGQSVFFICQLLMEGLLNVNDLDPIRRYLPASERPRFSTRYSSFQVTPADLVLQICVIAESARLQQLLATYGIQSQTPHQIEPIQIWSPNELTRAYEYLGQNKKLKLTGRPGRPFGVLSTSKIYRACGKTVLCYPLLFEVSDFYLAQDMSLVIDDLKNDLAFLARCWKLTDRPTFCMMIREDNMRDPNFSEFLALLSQCKRGEVDGIKVRIGKLQSLISSGCVEHLDFLHVVPDPDIFCAFEEKIVGGSFKSLTDIPRMMVFEDADDLSTQELHNKSSWDLVQWLMHVDGLKGQCQILQVLFEREGPNFRLENYTVEERLEKVLRKAGAHKNWRIVRTCAALLGKLVDSLAPSITTALVRGKQLTVGVFGHEEDVLDKPLSPNEIKSILYSRCMPYNIIHAVLQQELIIGIGKLIASQPELFCGILKIRIGWFVRAMEMELEQDDQKEGTTTDLSSLSPFKVRRLLYAVVTRNTHEADFRTPLQKRQLDGALNRVPKDFYDRVWTILEKTPGGIKVAGYLLQQQPTLSDMTMYELNFSLLVEQMLSKIGVPSYRQILVETFMVISTILQRNPEMMFHQTVNMDKIIQDAFDEFQKDLSEHNEGEKQDDMMCFFNTPPNIKHGTTSYIAKAVIRFLLDGELKTVNTEETCTVS